MVTNIERRVHHRFARSADNIAIVSESVNEGPNMSISWRSRELGLSYCTTWNVCMNNRQWTAMLRTKFSSAMKHILDSVGILINKIVIFGVLRIIK